MSGELGLESRSGQAVRSTGLRRAAEVGIRFSPEPGFSYEAGLSVSQSSRGEEIPRVRQLRSLALFGGVRLELTPRPLPLELLPIVRGGIRIGAAEDVSEAVNFERRIDVGPRLSLGLERAFDGGSILIELVAEAGVVPVVLGLGVGVVIAVP